MARKNLAVSMVVLGALVFPSVALAADQCKSDTGSFQSVLVPPPTCTSAVGICTLGTLDGKFPETYYFVMDSLVPDGDPSAPNRFLYAGHSVITRIHGGATLIGHDSGVLFLEGALNPFVTTVQIVGGTKEYADASGQFVAAGQINFVNGQATGTFTSAICK